MNRSLVDRKGSCNICGICCSGCAFLTKNNRCRVYNERLHYGCHIFPIDKFDLWLLDLGDICAYYWENNSM